LGPQPPQPTSLNFDLAGLEGAMERFDRVHAYLGMSMLEAGFICVVFATGPGGVLAVGVILNILGAAILAAKLNYITRHRDALRAQLLRLHQVPVSVMS
jgi:energy-converting hydrogenase Eha subunit C